MIKRVPLNIIAAIASAVCVVKYRHDALSVALWAIATIAYTYAAIHAYSRDE